MPWALGGSVLGTGLQLQQPALDATWLYASLCVPALGALAWAFATGRDWPRHSGAWCLVLLFAAMLAFGATGLRALAFAQHTLDPALEGRDLSVTGVVGAMPQRNEAGLRFRLDVESAHSGATPVLLPSSIYLGWYAAGAGMFRQSESDSPLENLRQPGPLAAGERWHFTVRLKAPHGASNPHGFDYELWLWEQGLQATGYVRATASDAPPQRLGQTGAHPVERLRQRVREAIYARVQERATAGVIAALVVGDQNAIERADWDIFRATGVAHLMSISGLHITMFAWASAFLVGSAWRRSTRLCLAWPADGAALVGGLLLAGAYAFFSGWGVPSQRTCLMLLTVSLLRLAGKHWPWPQVWLLACAVVVAADPWALLQSGFWLSFVAVGVLFAGATDAGASVGRAGLRSRLLAGAREQWLVTLALAPLSLLLFGQVSLVGLLANALAIPWVTLVLTPLALLGSLFAPVWDLAALCVQALSVFLRVLASLPFATFSVAQPPLWAAVAGVAGGLLLALQLPLWLRLGGLPLILPVLLWQAPRPAMGHFELLAADIGQGNAILVRTSAHALLFDTGPRYSRESDAGHRMLVPLLRALDTKVDTVLLSHRDSDHIGGAVAVLQMQPQAELLSSIEDDHELQAVRTARRCIAGQRWTWDGVDFAILHPQADDYDRPNRSNAMSCVLRVSNRLAGALLTGDLEQAQEARLVGTEAAEQLRADVLLVPHHGSKTSSSGAFLDAVQPRIALVQAGYRNRFGHPAASVLARYRERGIAVVDSAHCGAATWDSAAPAQLRCQRHEAMRYWQHRVP